MSCFPTWFRRQKSSFRPAEDINKETLLKRSNASEQTGRYIQRDENSFLTNNSVELSVHQQRLQSKQEQIKDNETLKRIKNTDEGSQEESTNDLNTTNKKFVAQKHKKNTNSGRNERNSNEIVFLNAQSKFKPVKGRRPTSLPTEAPHLEADNHRLSPGNHYDDVDGVGVGGSGNRKEDEKKLAGGLKAFKMHRSDPFYLSDANAFSETGNSNASRASNVSSLQAVKFFIGRRDSDLSSFDANLRSSAANLRSSAANLKTFRPTIGTKSPNRENSEIATSTSRSEFSFETTTDSSSRGQHDSWSNNSKTTSTTSNSSNKFAEETRTEAPEEVVYVPPPPPLPPQLLTSASSPALFITRSHTRTSRLTLHSDEHDQTPTSKDSDGSDSSPKSHRPEGGLIFVRPNLVKKDTEIEYIQKNKKTRNLIRTAIEKNDFLNNYMDKERKEMVIDAMEPAAFEQYSYIIHENEEGSEIFVSEEGYFDVLKAGKVVGTLGPGTVFGELAILYNAKRFASIKATTDAFVWKIDREKFRNIMVISGSRERQENLNFLRSAPFLQELDEDVLNRVVDLLQRKFYESNTCIVREGEVGNDFFIIRGGTVTIKKKNEYDVERVVDRRKRGDYFGEQALLNADRRQASVYADPPGTECLKLDREAFIRYLGTIRELREKPTEHEVDGRGSNGKSEFQNEYANIELSELKQVAILGSGAFGRVDLVACRDKTFALKIIKKIDIVKQDQVEHVYSEKHVMMKCSSSPFIIELYKTFRNDKFVYFLMEACMGGDVWTVMSQRRFFDEKTARFIAGCVVEAFDFLHSHHIIYRDLKPENLMLTTDGYCKLVDFGFAKYVPPNQKTNTFAGTPEYVAPEIILDRGHDRAVDYWALGILIFELLVGKTPFRGQNQIKIYQQILGGIDVIQMPSKIHKAAQNLIKNLCKQLPVERLGYQRKGILDIKKHSWFDHLDWSKLKAKQLVSPIKRPVTSNTDTQYFVPSGFEDDHDPPDETSGWDVNF